MKGKFIAGLILLVPVLIFAVQNSNPIGVRFIQWEFAVPLALLVYASLVIGIILGILFSYVTRVRKNRKEKRRQQEKKDPQSETAPQPAVNKSDSATVLSSSSEEHAGVDISPSEKEEEKSQPF